MLREARPADEQSVWTLPCFYQQFDDTLGHNAGNALAQTYVCQQVGARAVAAEAQDFFP